LERQWRDQLKQGRPIDDIIDEVAAHFQSASGEERHGLFESLVYFLLRAKRNSEAVQIVDEMIGQFPDDVLYPIAKASLSLYFLKDLEKALSCIDLALQQAYRSGEFRRDAFGVKARIPLRHRQLNLFVSIQSGLVISGLMSALCNPLIHGALSGGRHE
jgi:hypothetical protein